MSRYLFVPFPAHGHVNPMSRVVSELVARGEDVRVVVPPGFAEAVRRLDAEAVELATDFEVHVPDRAFPQDGWRWLRARTRRLSARKAAANAVRAEVAVRPPDLVVVDTMAYWASRVAGEYGIRDVPFSTTFTRRRERVAVVNAVPELQPVPGHLMGPLIRAHDTVDCDLPWDRIVTSKTLLVSPGTVFARKAEFLRWIAEAFEGTDWAVVMASGSVDPSELGGLPENVIARGKVPQLALLAHAEVFITHGGMNPVLESLAAGVPMLLAPRSREQRATSRRLVGLGVGVELAPADVRHQVERISGDHAVRSALSAFRGLAENDHVAVVADFLHDVISRGAMSVVRTSP